MDNKNRLSHHSTGLFDFSEDMKQMKRRGHKEHLKQGDEQNKFIYYNNKTSIDT